MTLPQAYIQFPLFPTGKVCTKCGVEKPYEAFSRHSGNKDGYRFSCKACDAAAARAYNQAHRAERTTYRREWRQKNLERDRERQRKYEAEHADQVKEWARASYMRHREERLSQQRTYRVEHADRKKQRDREYCEQHKDQKAAYDRERYQQRKEEVKARAYAWAKQHPDRRQATTRRYRQKNLAAYAAYGRLRAARRSAAEGHHTAADIADIYDDQGGLCYYCARSLNGKYHVDHRQPVTKGGSEWPDNLCCACERCNTRKRDMTEAQFKALLAQEACTKTPASSK